MAKAKKAKKVKSVAPVTEPIETSVTESPAPAPASESEPEPVSEPETEIPLCAVAQLELSEKGMRPEIASHLTSIGTNGRPMDLCHSCDEIRRSYENRVFGMIKKLAMDFETTHDLKASGRNFLGRLTPENKERLDELTPDLGELIVGDDLAAAKGRAKNDEDIFVIYRGILELLGKGDESKYLPVEGRKPINEQFMRMGVNEITISKALAAKNPNRLFARERMQRMEYSTQVLNSMCIRLALRRGKVDPVVLFRDYAVDFDKFGWTREAFKRAFKDAGQLSWRSYADEWRSPDHKELIGAFNSANHA